MNSLLCRCCYYCFTFVAVDVCVQQLFLSLKWDQFGPICNVCVRASVSLKCVYQLCDQQQCLQSDVEHVAVLAAAYYYAYLDIINKGILLFIYLFVCCAVCVLCKNKTSFGVSIMVDNDTLLTAQLTVQLISWINFSLSPAPSLFWDMLTVHRLSVIMVDKELSDRIKINTKTKAMKLMLR